MTSVVSVMMLASGIFPSCSGNAKADQNFTLDSISQIEFNNSDIAPGLGCDFSIGGETYLLVTNAALIKTNGVLTLFALDDDHSMSIINYGGTFGNKKIRVLIDREEPIVSYGEETTVRNGTLTVRRDNSEQSINGLWTCVL